MPTDDEEKTKQEENEPLNEMNGEVTPEFLLALNRFVLDVAEMEWPEEFPLSSDRKFCFSVFQRYWRLQMRHQRESERGNGEFHMRFEGGNKEEIRRFMQHRFGRMFGEDEPSLNIDPEQHDPAEEHVDERAKERRKRFQNEWE
jgi:hypothetical protein|tara:strand:- start:3958 stop:4389 length:432 start_codon:yes stop_codon:yes gene_type:complete